jgi:hypothetical protein
MSAQTFPIALRIFLCFSSREMTTTSCRALSDLSFAFHRIIVSYVTETFEINKE